MRSFRAGKAIQSVGPEVCARTLCATMLLFGAAGARGQQAPVLPVAPVAPAGSAAKEPARGGQAQSTMRRAREWKQFAYTCEGGAKLTVYMGDAIVKVAYDKHVYLMKQVLSADGGRYSDGKTIWWSVGNGGFLQEDTPDGNGAMIVKDCKLDQPMHPESATGSVTGTVSYRVRMALPPSALIQVELQDVSLADAPATVVVEQKMTLGERQVPVRFALKFDPSRIDPKHTYSVSARISTDGQLRFINDQSYPVITRGNPSHVEMMLKQVETPDGTK
jgi:putative lipoprotein